MEKYVQVLIAIGTKEDAYWIGQATVEKRLAACAKVVGSITSIYWWRGFVENTEKGICFEKHK